MVAEAERKYQATEHWTARQKCLQPFQHKISFALSAKLVD